MADVTITPDTKDWTWVLERPCPECGLDTRSFPREEIPAMLRANAAAWRAPLLAPGATDRSQPDRWSSLEYGCHVRDVFRIFNQRLVLMINEDGPTFANWDQDATAVADGYGTQDAGTVGSELSSAAGELADTIDRLSAEDWTRTGTRSDGAQFTVETLTRYLIHDPVHHLYDVGVGGA